MPRSTAFAGSTAAYWCFGEPGGESDRNGAEQTKANLVHHNYGLTRNSKLSKCITAEPLGDTPPTPSPTLPPEKSPILRSPSSFEFR